MKGKDTEESTIKSWGEKVQGAIEWGCKLTGEDYYSLLSQYANITTGKFSKRKIWYGYIRSKTKSNSNQVCDDL
jgi:hypothetical protein